MFCHRVREALLTRKITSLNFSTPLTPASAGDSKSLSRFLSYIRSQISNPAKAKYAMEPIAIGIP